MRRTEKHINIRALVEAMRRAGAGFRAMPGGTWLVENLGDLPEALKDEFFACDEKALGAHLRATATDGEKAEPAALCHVA